MDPIFISITLLVILLCLLALSWFAGSSAPYLPTTSKLLNKALKAAGVKKNTIFYELGSGDGRVVLAAARLGAKAYGVEQSYLRVLYSRYQARKHKLPQAQFYHGDIFTRNYYSADVVYIYLLSEAVAKLEQKLKQELKKGARVITQTYHFSNWPPIKKIGNFWIYQKS